MKYGILFVHSNLSNRDEICHRLHFEAFLRWFQEIGNPLSIEYGIIKFNGTTVTGVPINQQYGLTAPYPQIVFYDRDTFQLYHIFKGDAMNLKTISNYVKSHWNELGSGFFAPNYPCATLTPGGSVRPTRNYLGPYVNRFFKTA